MDKKIFKVMNLSVFAFIFVLIGLYAANGIKPTYKYKCDELKNDCYKIADSYPGDLCTEFFNNKPPYLDMPLFLFCIRQKNIKKRALCDSVVAYARETRLYQGDSNSRICADPRP